VLAARFNASLSSGALARQLAASGLHIAELTFVVAPRVAVAFEVSIAGIPAPDDFGTSSSSSSMDETGPESVWHGNNNDAPAPGAFDWMPPSNLPELLEGAMALEGLPPGIAAGITITVGEASMAPAPAGAADDDGSNGGNGPGDNGATLPPPPLADLMAAAAAAIFGAGGGSGAAAVGVIVAACVAACVGTAAVVRAAKWAAANGVLGRSGSGGGGRGRGSARGALSKVGLGSGSGGGSGWGGGGGGRGRSSTRGSNYLQMSELGDGGSGEEALGVFERGGDGDDDDDGRLGLMSAPRSANSNAV
jgi:hypothetical protein